MKEYSASQDSTRIVKNSIILLVRMVFIMIINLYAVRLLLNGMGVESYGIFNAVAGVVLIASGVSTVMSTATQRFLSIAIGHRDKELITKTLSTSINISFFLSIIAIILFESVGLYITIEYLQYPETMFSDVMMLYQFVTMSFFCAIMQIPFQALILANEDMKTFSIVSLSECILKFFAALSIPYCMVSSITFYGFALLCIAIFSITFYIISCKHIQKTLYKKSSDWHFHKEMLMFSAWMLLGSCASSIMSYGNNTLLNVYFGPVITASFAIALQVNVAFNSFSNNITMAIRPAMIRTYAEGNTDFMESVFNFSNKGLYFSLMLIAIPIIYELPTILQFWLGKSDATTILFTRLFIIYTVILTMNNPISIIVHATGNIKKYVLYVETITLMTFPFIWILFNFGFPAEYALYTMIAFCIIAHITRLLCLKKVYKKFNISAYIFQFACPAILVTILSAVIIYLINISINTWYYRWGMIIVVYTSLTLLIINYIGLKASERNTIFEFIKNKTQHISRSQS